MKFRCIDNQDVETLLTVGKEYAGEYHHTATILIFRCEDKRSGWFSRSRFVPAVDTMLTDDVKINSYTLTVEK